MTAKRFSKVSAAVWRSARFRGLPTDAAKLLYHYYLSCEHQNLIGAYRIPDGYALDDLGWTAKVYTDARKALVAAGLIAFDDETSTLYVERWFKHSPPMNASHAEGCFRRAAELESPEIAEKVLADLAEAEDKRKAAANPIPDPPAYGLPQRGSDKWPVKIGNGRAAF